MNDNVEALWSEGLLQAMKKHSWMYSLVKRHVKYTWFERIFGKNIIKKLSILEEDLNRMSPVVSWKPKLD